MESVKNASTGEY